MNYKKYAGFLLWLGGFIMLGCLSAVFAEDIQDPYPDFPNTLQIYKQDLNAESSKYRTCKDIYSCRYHKEYIKALRAKINSITYGAKRFKYIQDEYGKDTYIYIVQNHSMIETSFDEYFVEKIIKEATTIGMKDAVWMSPSKWSGLSRKDYYDQLSISIFHELDAERRNTKDLQEKATISYEIFLLFTFQKLCFIKSSANSVCEFY